MKKVILALFLSILSFGFAQEVHWGYKGDVGPEHWAEFEGAENCGTCTHQSPINIQTQNVVKTKSENKTLFQYKDGVIKDIIDNGHTLQFDFEKGTSLVYQNKTYELKQFHAHEGSEHLIDGVRYPLEFHFVHIANDGHVLVVGVLVKEGEDNGYFNRLDAFKDLDDGQFIKTSISFNPEKLYPLDKHYFTYTGSLTTPPCSGEVTWLVFQHPISLNENTIEEIGKHLPDNNFRPVQPLNGRVVYGN